MRENKQYGRHYFVAMVVYTFNVECYSSVEVNEFSEDTCKALAKHDSENVRIYKYGTKDIDNICKVMNTGVFVRVFEK